MICSLKFWARMAAVNVAAALTVGFAFNGVTLHTPWQKAAEIMGVGFLFSSIISSMCAITISAIAPRLFTRVRFPFNWTILVAVLVVLLVLPRVTSKIPAVLVAVVGVTAISAVLGLSDHIATVGTLPSGFPKPTVPWTSVDDVWPLLVAAVGITLVSLTDTIATSASFAARRGDSARVPTQVAT